MGGGVSFFGGISAHSLQRLQAHELGNGIRDKELGIRDKGLGIEPPPTINPDPPEPLMHEHGKENVPMSQAAWQLQWCKPYIA